MLANLINKPDNTPAHLPKQQVNLFQPARPKPIWYSPQYGVLTLILLVNIGLWQVYGRAQHRIQVLQQQITAVTDDISATSQQLEQLTAQQAQIANAVNTTDAHAEWITRLQSKQQILQLFADKTVTQKTRFSPYLAALARQTPTQLWLTDIDLQVDLHHISVTLQGIALYPELVPLFITNLNTEPSFAPLAFTIIDLQRTATHEAVRFRIATATDSASTE